MVCKMKSIAVLSGKGGVGKSTIATSLSVELGEDYEVGLLDVDIHGPNLPEILDNGSIEIKDEMLVPAEVGGLKIYFNGSDCLEGPRYYLGGRG